MAFNRAGFTAAAKAMGYSDQEIEQVAILSEAQANQAAANPWKSTGNYQSDIAAAMQPGSKTLTSDVDRYWTPPKTTVGGSFDPSVAPGTFIPTTPIVGTQNQKPSLDAMAFQKEAPKQQTTTPQSSLEAELKAINDEEIQARKWYPDRKEEIKGIYDLKRANLDPIGSRLAADKASIKTEGTEQQKAAFKTSMKDKYKELVDLMNNKSRYPSESAYQTALKAKSSEIAQTMFEVGGKVLSKGEQAVLNPQMPVFADAKKTSKGNIVERGFGWLTGSAVPEVTTTQQILDTKEPELREKAAYFISQYGTPEEQKKYIQSQQANQGVAPTGQPLPSPDGMMTKPEIQLTTEEDPKVLGNIILSMIPGGQYTKETIQQQLQAIGAKDPAKLQAITQEWMKQKDNAFAQDAVNMVKGLPGFLAGKFGTPIMSGAELLGGEKWGTSPELPIIGTQKSFQQQYRDLKGEGAGDIVAAGVPVAQWLLAKKGMGEAEGMVKGQLPAIKTKIGLKAPEVKPVVEPGMPGSKAGAEALKATGMKPKTIAEGERLSAKGLQMTEYNNPADMAKDMPIVKKKAGDWIDSYVKQNDKVVGPRSLPESEAKIRLALENSEAGRTELGRSMIDEIMRDVNLRMKEGNIADARGTLTESTTFEKQNSARKSFNADAEKWYERGKPMNANSQADTNSALRAEVAKAIKNDIAELDTTPDKQFRTALDMQHTAFELEPELTKAAMAKHADLNALSMRFAIAKKVWSSIFDPMQVANARKMVGPNIQYQKILNGELPTIETGPSATINPTFYRSPANAEILKSGTPEPYYKAPEYQNRPVPPADKPVDFKVQQAAREKYFNDLAKQKAQLKKAPLKKKK